MEKGDHGLSNVSLRTALSYPSMPCWQPPLQQPYGSCRDGRRAGSLRLSSTPLDTQCSTPLYFSDLVIEFILLLELTVFTIQLGGFSPFFLFEVRQLRESKVLKAVQIAYVVTVRYSKKTQESLRSPLIAFAYCINLDKHS
jgi:hypothetical protein